MTSCPSCGFPAPSYTRFCGRCGAALPNPTPYPPYTMMPPQKNNTAMVIVLVVVLVVAVPVVASAVLYVLVSGLISSPAPARPVVGLTLSTASSTQASVLVTGAQPAVAPTNFKVNLAANSTFGTAVNLPAGSYTSVNVYLSGYAGPFTVEWVDVGGDGVVNGGDQLVVTYPTALHAGLTMQFYLLWYDGAVVSIVSWGT